MRRTGRTRKLRRERSMVRPMGESLEDRRVPVTFGMPWPDATHLTLSFAPDGASAVGWTSVLSQELNAQLGEAAGRREILRAFQAWAAVTNINIGVVPDSGAAFGTPGPAQGDPRFGDLRVGALPMSGEVLAVNVPHEPFLSGTWAGDVFLNASFSFGTGAGSVDLYSVMLHEAGNVFGLQHSGDANSPLNPTLNAVKTSLTRADVQAIQGVYGQRTPDRFDASQPNDTRAKASAFPIPGGFRGTVPLVLAGDRTTMRDVDFYKLQTLSGYKGPMTIRLQTRGVSLLAPRLTVLDERGRVLGQAASLASEGDVVQVVLRSVKPGGKLILRVDSPSNDVFGIGAYRLAVSYDLMLSTSPDVIDRVLLEPLDLLDRLSIENELEDPDHAFLNDDGGEDDTPQAARPLETPIGYQAGAHYTTVGSLAATSDVDVYRFQTPSAAVLNRAPALIITARSMDGQAEAPKVSVEDSRGQAIAAEVLARGGGVYSIQVVGLPPKTTYFVRVESSTPASSSMGNYQFSMDYGPRVNLTMFATATLSAASPSDGGTLYIAENQLFELTLSASSTPSRSGVQMTLYNEANQPVQSLMVLAGETRSGSVFLTPGTYRARFTAASADQSIPSVVVSLRGTRLSDPIGPVIEDPTRQPIFQAAPNNPNGNGYVYPPVAWWPDPYFWFGGLNPNLLPPENLRNLLTLIGP